jgi:hypothetical protein
MSRNRHCAKTVFYSFSSLTYCTDFIYIEQSLGDDVAKHRQLIKTLSDNLKNRPVTADMQDLNLTDMAGLLNVEVTINFLPSGFI